MSQIINASICLSDVQGFLKTGSNGKVYLNVSIAERREADRYGNTHSITVNKTKAEKEANGDKVYCGEGKVHVFENAQADPNAVNNILGSAAPYQGGNSNGQQGGGQQQNGQPQQGQQFFGGNPNPNLLGNTGNGPDGLPF